MGEFHTQERDAIGHTQFGMENSLKSTNKYKRK